MELVQSNKCFDGEQRIYRLQSEALKSESRFSIFLPAQALSGRACPVLFYLAGLTCTEETFAIKAHALRLAARLGLILIAPDTSPRGSHAAQGDSWDIGQGAGFYINALQAPWAEHYQMESYVADELHRRIIQAFPVPADAIGIFGHSLQCFFENMEKTYKELEAEGKKFQNNIGHRPAAAGGGDIGNGFFCSE